MPNIFEERENLLPYEYPELMKHKDAIRHSYWLDTEFNFTTDVNDFKVNISDVERDIISKTMLAISQIEVNVKSFWGDLYKRLPILEIQAVGATFSDAEVRHFDAYSRLLTILGLEEEFKNLPEVPAIKGRISYLKKYLSGVRSRDNRTYTKSIILFSLFIENVSLFSQFLIIMSFNKERNLFKGMSNAVEATSKEEAIHGQFGADLVNIIRSENPSWFDEDMESMVKSACIKALKAEEYILDWIFEKGELDFLPKSVVVEFMKKRFNTSMTMIGYDPIFEVDINLYDKVLWFDEELVSTKEGDFFDKKQIDYNKKSKSITEDDIF